jgi:hypothetical protein
MWRVAARTQGAARPRGAVVGEMLACALSFSTRSTFLAENGSKWLFRYDTGNYAKKCVAAQRLNIIRIDHMSSRYPLSTQIVLDFIKAADYDLSISLGELEDRCRNLDYFYFKWDMRYLLQTARKPEYSKEELLTTTLRGGAVEMLNYFFAAIGDADIGWEMSFFETEYENKQKRVVFEENARLREFILSDNWQDRSVLRQLCDSVDAELNRKCQVLSDEQEREARAELEAERKASESKKLDQERGNK